MHLQTIRTDIARWRTLLQKPTSPDLLSRYEAQFFFSQHWDPHATDVADMLARSLHTTLSRRLWSRRGYEPRKVLLELARYAPELVRSFFIELFDEQRPLTDRLDRFVFHFDELFADYQRHHPKCPWPAHFHHDDYQMASLYLSLRHPQLYAPYCLELLQRFLTHVRAPNPPLSHDLPRYFKVMRTLSKLLSTDTQLMKLHAQRLATIPHIAHHHLLMAEEFARFAVDMPPF